MIHVGMDEIQRNGGKGFVLNVKEGQEVSCGELLLAFDKEALEAQGYDVVTFLLFINRKAGQLHVLRGGNIKQGEEIIEVFSDGGACYEIINEGENFIWIRSFRKRYGMWTDFYLCHDLFYRCIEDFSIFCRKPVFLCKILGCSK